MAVPHSQGPADRPGRKGALPFAVGCLLAIPGFFGGGMMAVAVARLVGEITQCKPPDGLPACHTFEYLLVGCVVGVLVLPVATVWQLRRGGVGWGVGGWFPGRAKRRQGEMTRNSQRS